MMRHEFMGNAGGTIDTKLARPRLLAFATQGSGGQDEQRLRALLSRLPAEFLEVDRSAGRLGTWLRLVETLRETRPALVVMEGTGLAGGLALLASGVRYVVSSGDAVGPWVAQRHPWLGPLFSLYERALCARAAGVIGWTPYLAGRALGLGAPRAMTAPGWADDAVPAEERAAVRAEFRARAGIPADALVVGMAGSLAWNARRQSCYGMELVRALERVRRSDVHVLVVGDGEGRERLEREVSPGRRARLHLVGRVPRAEVARWLCAMDLASLPQTLDGVGLFRFTTKLPEYQAAGLPVLTGRLPAAYDLPGAWVRLPGSAPWDARYLDALAAALDGMDRERLAALRAQAVAARAPFSREAQEEAVAAFVSELLGEAAA
jgi:hypothetical protein